MIEVGPAAELELGTGRRGGTSSSSSSTTRELLLGIAGGLPRTLAELVEQLLAEDEEAAAVSLAVLASTRLSLAGPAAAAAIGGTARSPARAGLQPVPGAGPLPGAPVRVQ